MTIERLESRCATVDDDPTIADRISFSVRTSQLMEFEAGPFVVLRATSPMIVGQVDRNEPLVVISVDAAMLPSGEDVREGVAHLIATTLAQNSIFAQHGTRGAVPSQRP